MLKIMPMEEWLLMLQDSELSPVRVQAIFIGWSLMAAGGEWDDVVKEHN